MGVPDGATPEAEANNETAQDAPPPEGEETEPPPPDQQVDNEITSAEVRDWLGGIFGNDAGNEHESGGGGAGGEFLFADLAELDAVIGQWNSQRDEIQADQERIIGAYHDIAEPAGDEMSVGQAEASRESLLNMWKHNFQMLQYTDNYIKNLQGARGYTQAQDEDAETVMRTTYDA